MKKKILILPFIVYIATCRLIYGFAVARHGVKYSFDAYYAPEFKEFKADLAPTGIRQMYNLGKYFRETYTNEESFLPLHFDGSIQGFSSSLQRTQLSMYALVYGLYPLQQGASITERVPQELLVPPYQRLFSNHLITEPNHSDFALRQGFSPIPVHPSDYILDSCTNIDLLEGQRSKELAEKKQKLYEQHIIVIQKMKKAFKLPSASNNIDLMLNIYRDLESDYYLGLPLPQNVILEEHDQLKFIYNYYSALFNQGQLGKVLVTLTLQLMRAKILQAAGGESMKKMLFIVCHSSTMWPLMVNLNITSSSCIEQKRNGIPIPEGQNCEIGSYASSLVLQLHEDERTLDISVKIRSNGKYMNVCERKEQACPLQEFLLRLKRTEQDYELFCGPRPSKDYITVKL